MMLYKRYVDVIVLIQKDSKMRPLKIIWDNGVSYGIDKVLSVERRSSVVGGGGIRYEVKIEGQRRYLFFEKNRWFIESTKP